MLDDSESACNLRLVQSCLMHLIPILANTSSYSIEAKVRMMHFTEGRWGAPVGI